MPRKSLILINVWLNLSSALKTQALLMCSWFCVQLRRCRSIWSEEVRRVQWNLHKLPQTESLWRWEGHSHARQSGWRYVEHDCVIWPLQLDLKWTYIILCMQDYTGCFSVICEKYERSNDHHLMWWLWSYPDVALKFVIHPTYYHADPDHFCVCFWKSWWANSDVFLRGDIEIEV